MTTKLRVEEALRSDIDRKIARVTPTAAKTIGVDTGDFIAIKGKKVTHAMVWKGSEYEDEDEIIRIESVIRWNAEVNLDEFVEVWKVIPKMGKSITLSNEQNITISKAFLDQLADILDGKVITNDDIIPVQIGFGFFGQTFYFRVVGTTPESPIIFNEGTRINYKGQIETTPGVSKKAETNAPSRRIMFEDIGGLHEPIRKIRELIELPLRHPELFEQLGITPPQGLLLYGPSGSGKTLLAKAVANETSSHFVTINGPEIMSKFYGESENKLREIFAEAEKNAPTIIFIDEIDSIAPKRSETVGEVEKRIVSQLLTLMDGLNTRDRVVVIAATNRPDALDESLRRGGRFDREIEIGIPDAEARNEILMIHTRGMPLAADVNLKNLANRTHGYVGADIESLAKEAAMYSLRDIMRKIDLSGDQPISYELLSTLKVSMNDFETAMRDIVPSAMREVFVEKANVEWEDIGGLEDVKLELIKAVEWPLQYPDLFDAIKGKPAKGILLYGPPGTGKTMLAKAVANKLEANFISIKGPEIFNKYVGESERAVREIFRKARAAAPCVIFFDEIDAIASTRGQSDTSGVSQKVVSQLLIELDGLEELKGVFLMGATNRPDIIDPALRRPGRFDKLIKVGIPDLISREEIFKAHFKGSRISDEVDFTELARQTEGFTGAEIALIVEEAKMFTIEEFVEMNLHGKYDKSSLSHVMVTAQHVEKAMKDKFPSVEDYNLEPPKPSELRAKSSMSDFI